MPIPVIVPVAVLALATYASYKHRQANAPAVSNNNVPIPPANPMGGPPMGTLTLPTTLDLVVDLTQNPQIGQLVPVTFTYKTGPNAGDAGGSSMPLAWVSPDGSQAAVVWSLQSGGPPEARFGAVYLGRKLITAFT